MFNRDYEFKYLAKTFDEEVTLAHGETEQARFNAWLAEKLATPYFCEKHPQTRLVLDLASSGINQAYEEYRYGETYPRERPGIFHFRAALRCPACRCAYALCPPEFHTTSFETFDTSTTERANALARCREFTAQVNKHGCGFEELVGRPGTGKTLLACNIVRELNIIDALYTRQGELTVALRATYGRKDVFLHRPRDEGDEDSPPTPLEIVQRVRFVILDELGCNPLANDERLLLDELIKHRYDERKPTILISNLPLDQLKEFLGDALTDRIKHATGNGKFILQFSGESYRRTAGENYLEGLK